MLYGSGHLAILRSDAAATLQRYYTADDVREATRMLLRVIVGAASVTSAAMFLETVKRERGYVAPGLL